MAKRKPKKATKKATKTGNKSTVMDPQTMIDNCNNCNNY